MFYYYSCFLIAVFLIATELMSVVFAMMTVHNILLVILQDTNIQVKVTFKGLTRLIGLTR